MYQFIFIRQVVKLMASLLTKRLASEPVSKVEVHVSCDKLLNKDVTSKSDPCCLLYMMTNGQWLEVNDSFFMQNNFISP